MPRPPPPEEASANMRLLLALAAQLDRVVRFDLGCAERLLVNEPHDGSQDQVGADDDAPASKLATS